MWNPCGVILICRWVRDVIDSDVNYMNLALQHTMTFGFYQIAVCLCIWWLYFHVTSNQFLYVSNFVILLEVILEE